MPAEGLPGIVHITIGGPPHSSSHLWDSDPGILRLHLLSDTEAKTAAPARDAAAVTDLLRRLENHTLDILLIELCPAAGGSPTIGPESSQSINLVHEHVFTLATTCAEQSSRVILCAPVTSMAWKNRSTIVTLSDQKWHRFRAPSPREAGTAYSGQSWLWYSTCDTLAADVKSQKTLAPLQALMRQSGDNRPEEDNSSRLGGGDYAPKTGGERSIH